MSNVTSSAASAEMPRYRCIEAVWALQIKAVVQAPIEHVHAGGSWLVHPVEAFAPIEVDHDFVLKHDPQPGGYIVFHAGGGRSYRPAAEFSACYVAADSSPRGVPQ